MGGRGGEAMQTWASRTHAVYVGVSTDGRDGHVVPHSMNDSREQQQRRAASSP